MRTVSLGNSSLVSSRLAYGCWRIAGKEADTDCQARGRKAVIAAYEAGYTLFDHADIYGQGRAEILFGQVLKAVSGMRERVVNLTADTFLMIKDLEDHSKAVGLCNRGQMPQTSTAKWSEVGVDGNQIVRNLWRQRDLGAFKGSFSAAIDWRGVMLVRMRPPEGPR